MDFLEKLNYLMKKQKLNKNTLSKACNIPYTTIDGWYKKGYEGLKMTTLRKLAYYFGTTLDFWANEEIFPDSETLTACSSNPIFDLQPDILEVFEAYKKATLKEKNTVRTVLDLPLLGKEDDINVNSKAAKIPYESNFETAKELMEIDFSTLDILKVKYST